MQTSEKAMNDIETLQQNQGYATAQQVSAYQNAYSNWVTAQANAESAAASMLTAQSTKALNDQKILESQNAIKIANQKPPTTTNTNQNNSTSYFGNDTWSRQNILNTGYQPITGVGSLLSDAGLGLIKGVTNLWGQ